ncbi:MAG: superoxide dismutase family protein, partial [Pseudomonadota bacterium]
MNVFNLKSKLALTLLSAAVLAACSDSSDVTPANNSNFILAEDNTPPPTETVVAANGEVSTETRGARVVEEDFLPEEYRRAGEDGPANMAIATIQPTNGNTASGMVAFIQTGSDDGQIRVVGKIINIPAGIHGFHIHEIGNCTAPDGSSAGDHFNPDGSAHGDR